MDFIETVVVEVRFCGMVNAHICAHLTKLSLLRAKIFYRIKLECHHFQGFYYSESYPRVQNILLKKLNVHRNFFPSLKAGEYLNRSKMKIFSILY